jgi:hypothetical protein
MALIHVAADIHPLMARDATERLKQLVPSELLGGYRVDVAFEPTIKSAARRKKSTLIGRDRAEESRDIRLAAKGFAKLTRDIRVGPQFVQRFVEARPLPSSGGSSARH